MTDSDSVPVKVTETTTVEAVPERPDNWRTLLLVGGIMAIGIIFAGYAFLGARWGTFALFLCGWEGWTLLNKYKEDTISEAIWILARRPITVLLFALGFGVPAGAGYFGDMNTICRGFAIGLLYGHFFFTPVQPEAVVTKTRKGRA